MYVVDYYRDKGGKCPVVAFVDSVDVKMRAKLFGRLELLEKYGPLLMMPYGRHLRDGIYELRAVFGSNITRLLYFFADNRRAIVTNGFVKKTQRTPRSEIDRAKRLREDWMARHERL